MKAGALRAEPEETKKPEWLKKAQATQWRWGLTSWALRTLETERRKKKSHTSVKFLEVTAKWASYSPKDHSWEYPFLRTSEGCQTFKGYSYRFGEAFTPTRSRGAHQLMLMLCRRARWINSWKVGCCLGSSGASDCPHVGSTAGRVWQSHGTKCYDWDRHTMQIVLTERVFTGRGEMEKRVERRGQTSIWGQELWKRRKG